MLVLRENYYILNMRLLDITKKLLETNRNTEKMLYSLPKPVKTDGKRA